MWEARAVYYDGTTVERLFEYKWEEKESDQMYSIEIWLKDRHPGLVWMSVNYICV